MTQTSGPASMQDVSILTNFLPFVKTFLTKITLSFIFNELTKKNSFKKKQKNPPRKIGGGNFAFIT